MLYVFDWEPAFCHLVVSRHCTALCCAIACDMPKSALPTQYFLKQDPCPDAVGKNLVCVLFTVLGKASSTGNHPLRKNSASLSWWEGPVVALGEISVQRLLGEEIHSPWKRLAQEGSPWRERVVPAERSWAVEIQCHQLALQKENVPASCQKMSCGSRQTSPYF